MHAANALSHLQQTTPQLMVIGVHELVLHGRCTWQIAVKGTEMGTQCLSLSLKRDPPRSRHNIRKLTKRHLWQQIRPDTHPQDCTSVSCSCWMFAASNAVAGLAGAVLLNASTADNNAPKTA